MRKIYTGIDLGSDSIKILVSENVDQKFHTLASTTVRSVGIKKGKIIDPNMAANSVKLAVKEVEEMLGLKLEKAIINVPLDDCEMTIASGMIDLEEEEEITEEEVVKVLHDALLGEVPEGRELVTAIPIGFVIDESEEIVKDPKGLSGNQLSVKVVVTTVPKANVYQVLSMMKLCNIEVVDITFGATADYYGFRNKGYDSKVGAIIDIGAEKTEISIFNKGIMIKNAILPVGGKNVDRDISYIYKLDLTTSRHLKETFAVSSERYADANDVVEIEGKTGEKLLITQKEISAIVESRLEEILKLAKKQINLLTNREIRYIIITGGISELAGFQYVVENIFGRSATTLNMTTMGIRHNKYSSVLGMLKYFDQKLALRGKEYSMFQESKIEEMKSTKKKPNLSNDTVISKVFGHFFEN